MVHTESLPQQERRHWLGIVEEALQLNPDVVSLLYDRAAILRTEGEFEKAEAAYLVLLAKDPGNFSGLIELSAIYMHQGRYIDALNLRSDLLARNPDDASAIAYFAHVILISGDVVSAQMLYEQALKLAPNHTLVHAGLAEVMRRQGRDAEAASHDIAASLDQAFFPRQFRGKSTSVPLLLFVSEAEDCESCFGDRIIDEATFLVTKCIVERVSTQTPLPSHALMFNGIGDADRAAFALQKLTEIALRSDAPLINAPGEVGATGRVRMAERLQSIAGVRVPKMFDMTNAFARSAQAVPSLHAQGIDFPFLVRIPNYHAGRYFERVNSAEEFVEVIADFPRLPILAIEYIDIRDDASLYHKGRIMIVDDVPYPTHLAYGSQWKLHYFSSQMAHESELRHKEAMFLSDPRRFLGEKAWSAVLGIAGEIDLDYFGIDFALAPNGDIVIFECNAAMVVAKPGVETHWAYRRPAYDAMMRAADSMLKQRAATAISSPSIPRG